MPTFELNYDQAHKFVEKNKKLGFYWDGYSIMKWTPNEKGFMQTNGLFRNNKWGYTSRYTLTKLGTWKISDRYERYI